MYGTAIPCGWASQFEGGSGARFTIRPIEPHDAALYEAFFAGISLANMTDRLLGGKLPEVTPAVLAWLTQVDYRHQMAFVALEEHGTLAGVSRYASNDGALAEFAVLVRSDAQIDGLGEELLLKLIAYARAVGLAELRGEISGNNRPMLRLARKLGFERVPTSDPGIVTVRLQTLREGDH